ncbi:MULTISPECIES: hypothetical protein [Streptomyces]|uniref:Uncharacterized protein n=1 Tax=Streptomyces chartreusis NRRL 3882 TaxID=1079985 RepID=A0A2N9BEF4_STRCX|nr:MULTISPECIES: hypothetical protein [Streptomyces]MYS92552.1 hypothetical protein [Streptomyces sp. SID5464]SOR81758.1 hypothetical protein SCNRRL3882_5210 [Streptomyces chartreusis NRRL 3882]
MADFDRYGTCTHTAEDLVRLVSACLGVAFTERESDYRGVYHVADLDGVRVEVQPNEIPGDDEDEPCNAANPECHVLVLTTTPLPDPTLRTRLESVEGLVHLGHESV